MHVKPPPAPQGQDNEKTAAAGASAFARHGGNLAAARRLFPEAPEPWLDLSTGINPHAYPVANLPLEAFARLPDPSACRKLEVAAAAFYGAREPGLVVAAPGTQAIIQWLPRLFAAKNVGIRGLTYSEHARAWGACGANVTIVEDIEQLIEKDVAVVVNPNNPDGRLLPVEDLRRLADELAARGGLLVLDEAFVDLLGPSASLVPCLPSAAIVVLRSFGKTFGLAGIRLGFAIAPPPLAEIIRAALGPWAISGAAALLGSEAFSDPSWFAAMREKLTADGAELDIVLRAAGAKIIGSTPLYRLVEHKDAFSWFFDLAGAGILVRPFEARSNWLRFGIPAGDGECRRLRETLMDIVSARQREHFSI